MKERDRAFEESMEADFGITFKAETLVGNVRDFLLDRLKNDQDGRIWSQRPELEQEMVIGDAGRSAEWLVGRLVEIVAAGGHDVINASVDKVTNDGKVIKAQLSLSRMDEMRHALVDATGGMAMIVIVDKEQYGGADDVTVEPDQGSLPMGESRWWRCTAKCTSDS